MKLDYNIKGGDFASAGSASSQVKKELARLNLDPKLVRKTVVALYEAEVNVVAHAWSGQISVDINPSRIIITIRDKGPGIPSIDRAMEKGYSTASQKVREMGFGAGMGLPNIKDNTDKMSISSVIDEGTYLQFENFIA